MRMGLGGEAEVRSFWFKESTPGHTGGSSAKGEMPQGATVGKQDVAAPGVWCLDLPLQRGTVRRVASLHLLTSGSIPARTRLSPGSSLPASECSLGSGVGSSCPAQASSKRPSLHRGFQAAWRRLALSCTAVKALPACPSPVPPLYSTELAPVCLLHI